MIPDKKNILFTNFAHYGDLFVSRSFIKDIILKLPEHDYYYIHNYKLNYIFNDLKIKECNLVNELPTIHYVFDTWYTANNQKYFQDTKCSLQTLYKLFQDVYQTLGISLEPIQEYIPTIDFSFYSLIKKERKNKSILICNNVPQSGQSSTSDMTDFIEKFSSNYKDVTFFITNETSKDLVSPNIVYTKNILKKNDLIEISWLSTQCSTILGRTSGPYTYSILKENLNDNVKYIEIYNKNYEDINHDYENFGLPKLNYNNFLTIDSNLSWDKILQTINENVEEI